MSTAPIFPPASGSPVGVKVCGVLGRENAIACADAGIDALGINFYPKSKRFIAFDEASDWLAEIAARGVARVGVFVNAEADEVKRILDSGLIDVAQFHGDETPEYCREFAEAGLCFLKAFGVKNAESLKAIGDYHTDAVLLDAYCPENYGGSGETFDWELAAEVVASSGLRVVLSGGLGPENAGAAAAQVGPAAVDVASGVESAPGVKDLGLVERLVEAVR